MTAHKFWYVFLRLRRCAAELARPLHTRLTVAKPLRFDLHASRDACGPARMLLNGLPLSQNTTGGGQGAFTLRDGAVISASWDFKCDEEDEQQTMTLMVHSVNGRSVYQTKPVTASFRQIQPIRIHKITGAARVSLVHQKTSQEEHLEDEIVDSVDEASYDADLDTQIEALEDLRQHARTLRHLIREREAAIMKQLVYSDDTEDAVPRRPLKECEDLGCIFHGLAWKIKYAHGDVCHGSPQWRRVLGCDDRAEELPDEYYVMVRPGSSEKTLQSPSHPAHKHDHEGEHHGWHRKSPVGFVLKVTGALFLWYMIVHKGIALCLRIRRGRRQSIALEDDETPRRKLVFRDYFRGLYRRDGWGDEEQTQEKPYASVEQHASVADELSGLREAASMVSDIINASNRANPRRQREVTPPPAYESGDENGYSCLPQYSGRN